MVNAADRRAYATLVAAACVDGDLSAPEREVLHRLATDYDIPVGIMREIIDQGVQGKLAVAVPPGQAERETLLDDLIDVACADGRIEASEHHLLAKFSSHLGLRLPDLRARVRQRLQERSKPAPTPRPKAAPPEPPRGSPLAAREEPKPEFARAVFQAAHETPHVPALPPGPITLQPPSLIEGRGIDLPPVTLHLLKQAILFETTPDALRYVERTMNVTKPEAEALMGRILEAYPDLKPGSERLRGAIPKKK
jgi:uncharacterized tellurite resistance protein B-like protein